MTLLLRVVNHHSNYFQNITKQHNWSANKIWYKRLSNTIHYRNILIKPAVQEKKFKTLYSTLRVCSTQNTVDKNQPNSKPTNPGLVQRFKEMYKNYWYVLLPVHMTTCTIWFGVFYYCVRSGVDVIGTLEYIGISEKLLSPIKDSSAGYFALAIALYKLATPLRYAVTLGVTTYAIRKLTAIGWIKPLPSREALKKIIQEKKDNIQEKITENKQLTHIKDEWRKLKGTDKDTTTKE